MIPIALVEDNKALSQLLVYNLHESKEVEVLFTAENGVDFLRKMNSTIHYPSIVLMDVEMPFKNGIETVREAKVRYPDLTFIMLTVMDDEATLYETIQAGATGYLLKEEPISNTIKFLKDVAEYGSVVFSSRMAQKALSVLRSAPKPIERNSKVLSDREIEILQLLSEGKIPYEISEDIGISYHTIRKHISNIYKKLEVNNKTEAIKRGFKERWLRF